MLTLEIEWLLGIYFGARSPADRTPDWPPQPDRVFSALTASWGAHGSRPEETAALEWLEQQQPPTVEAVEHEPRSSATVFVPPNDAGANDIRILPDRRRRQPRQFPAATLQGEAGGPHLRLIWQAETPSDRLAALCSLARDTSYVGHSSSPVRCTFLDRQPESHAGLQTVATTSAPYPGRLRELAALYARHVATADENARPRSEPLISPVQPTAAEPTRSVFGARWRMLEFVDGDRPDLRAAAVVGRGMRDALMSVWPARIPEWLSGHATDGAPSHDPHLAVVPLGDVGFSYSDTARQPWHGLALVLPRAIEDAWVGADTPEAFANSHTLQSALDRLMQTMPDGDFIVLRLGKFGALRLRPVAVPEASGYKSLHPARYLRMGRMWSTVTPIALDRHTKSEDPRSEAAEIIRESCARIELPPAERVYVHKHAAITGAPSAKPPTGAPRWTGWARPGSLASRQLTHATLHFKEPVAGPVILGAGRFFGLGLCLPVEERTQR